MDNKKFKMKKNEWQLKVRGYNQRHFWQRNFLVYDASYYISISFQCVLKLKLLLWIFHHHLYCVVVNN